ncbi:hypothetical protein C8250_020945 [Streptomyces sp. So13.3]|uniref:hypothetical protein n=1 Tax=Streptomyces sp. So13.3 TaxID=2136173 RepID=UPI00164E61B9|nr:hypothetical protein [Streptomyces sp. So13.3]QNA74051.1 hypothetical protein C8250_020945 [Streptomyces sp. So13.3]
MRNLRAESREALLAGAGGDEERGALTAGDGGRDGDALVPAGDPGDRAVAVGVGERLADRARRTVADAQDRARRPGRQGAVVPGDRVEIGSRAAAGARDHEQERVRQAPLDLGGEARVELLVPGADLRDHHGEGDLRGAGVRVLLWRPDACAVGELLQDAARRAGDRTGRRGPGPGRGRCGRAGGRPGRRGHPEVHRRTGGGRHRAPAASR